MRVAGEQTEKHRSWRQNSPQLGDDSIKIAEEIRNWAGTQATNVFGNG